MNPPYVAPDRFDAGDFFIRRYEASDGAALMKATNESFEHLRPWMPWAKNDQTLEEATSLCRLFAGKYLLCTDFVLGIWRDKELVGGTGFHLRVGPLESRNAEIGMWIAGREAGKGLGTQALEGMLRWGFTEWDWERLVWKCDTRNLASARVAEKCGLRREGTFMQDAEIFGARRDTHLYAILKKEWLAGND